MILANKIIGETPLELIKRVANNGQKTTYAGRLDPMASGLMVLLQDNEVIDKNKYLSLDKQYDLKILFGLSTDSYDTLGIITNQDLNSNILESDIKKVIKDYKKSYSQTYPPYSSKTVKSKPLWWWAKNNKLNQIEIPTKNVVIKQIDITNIYKIKISTLVKDILNNISKVKGDFRQEDIISQWKELQKNNQDKLMTVATLIISCTSGTYMRSIANQVGKDLGIPALALKINRTKIGKYTI
jgi:tRNA pseudouridine55 synthase